MTPPLIPAYPFSHGPPFDLAVRLALRALVTLALPLSTWTFSQRHHLPLCASPCSRICVLRPFLAARPHVFHLALPNFVGVPPGTGEVRSTAVPYLSTLDSNSLGLAVSERETLHIASTLYDVLRLAALFDELGSEPKDLALVLALDVDARTRRQLLGVLAKTGEGLEVLELGLEEKSDEVCVHISWPLFCARSWR